MANTDSSSNVQGQEYLVHDHRRARRPVAGAGLARSGSDRVLAGISGGIAQFIGANPRVVRVLWIVSLPLSGGLTAIAYLLLWLLLPLERS